MEEPPLSDPLVEAVTDLAMVVKGKRGHVNCTGTDGLMALYLVEALVESSRGNGRPVAVKEVTHG